MARTPRRPALALTTALAATLALTSFAQAATTRLVKDINPGPDGSQIQQPVAYKGQAFFAAFTPAKGTELWKSDGTKAGTKLVKDIWPGEADWSAPSGFAAVGPRVFFAARTSAHGEELWRSDGTKTFRVRDINPGPADSEPAWLVKVGKRLFFVAIDGSHGDELWMWKP